ncbi:MAG TPA: hypothetical protein VGM41_10815 [Chitinophagaceae bacterium]
MKLLSWVLLGLVSYAAPQKGCNAGTDNNNAKPASVNGSAWTKKSDLYEADALKRSIQAQKDDLFESLSAASQQANSKSQKKRDEWEPRVAELEDMIALLDSSLYVLNQMDSAKIGDLFTFEDTTGTTGNTYRRNNNVITMKILNNVSAIHELAHAWQVHNGSIRGHGGDHMVQDSAELCRNEIDAYRRQYAFDPLSIQQNAPSYPKNAERLSDITANWVLGLHDGDDFVFWDRIKVFYQKSNPQEWRRWLDSASQKRIAFR